MDEFADFLVRSPKQILLHLKSLAAKQCLLSASFGENYSFLTVILDFRDKNRAMVIDCGPKEYLNKVLLSVGLVKFKAEFQGIKVFFEGRGIQKIGNLDNPALLVKIPEKIYWLQRRRFYRVRSPLSRNSYCLINLEESDDNNCQKEPVQFKLFDLSVSGFSLLVESQDIADRLVIDHRYDDCDLILDETDKHSVSFVIRSKITVNSGRSDKVQRIGCELINTSIRSETAFLRYMQNMERILKHNSKQDNHYE